MGIFEEIQEIERRLKADEEDAPRSVSSVELVELRNNLMGEIRALADLVDGLIDLLVLRGSVSDAEVRLAFQLVQRFQSADGSFEEYLASRREYLKSLL